MSEMAGKRNATEPVAEKLLGPSESWPTDKIGRWPLSKILPYPNNARVHPAHQIALLASILRRRGPDQPIVIDEDGVILKGHGRRLAALKAGMTGFPVIMRCGLSEQEKREIRLEDNQVSLLSAWDDATLREELTLIDVSPSALGFDDNVDLNQSPATQKVDKKTSTIFVTVNKKSAKKAKREIIQALDTAGIAHNL